jgi:hypothetical protein
VGPYVTVTQLAKHQLSCIMHQPPVTARPYLATLCDEAETKAEKGRHYEWLMYCSL